MWLFAIAAIAGALAMKKGGGEFVPKGTLMKPTIKLNTLVASFRRIVKQLAPEIPTDFLLAWIMKESNGKINVRSKSLDERSFFQVHPAEYTAAGITKAEFDTLITTKDVPTAMKIGLKMVRHKIVMAQKLLSDYGVTWGGVDFWRLVKSQHGAPGLVKAYFKKYQEMYGRSPASWDEMKRVVGEFKPKYVAMGQKITKNAEETAAGVIDPLVNA